MTRYLPTVAALLVLTLLAGCRDELGEGPMTPGIYSIVTADGSHNRAVFNKDGSFVDMEDNKPKPVDQGKWWREDGKLCMASTGTADPVCGAEKPLGDDGSFAWQANGVTLEFRMVAQ